jgi:hypothetical protein
MLATESTRTVETNEEISGQDIDGEKVKGASVAHTTSGRVLLWQPTRQSRWIPKTVSAGNIRENFDMGWRTECGNCGTTHNIEADPIGGADLNACPALEPLAVAYCPVCGGKFIDPGEEEKRNVQRDPNAIALYDKVASPETRLKAILDLHVLSYHKNDAAAYGIVDNRAPLGAVV